VKVSVVIPLYNKAAHIERAIQSVLAQTCPDFELIVVNDGSTDNGPQLVKETSDLRLRLIEQTNQGVSAARNRGIAESGADLIAFLDADDAWRPTFLEMALELRSLFPQAGAFATAIEWQREGQIIRRELSGLPPHPWKGLVQDQYFEIAKLGWAPISASSVAIPAQVFSDIGGFPEGATLGEDDDMWGRLVFRYPIAYTTEVGATYFLNSVNRAVKRECSPEGPPFVRTALAALAEGRVLEAMKPGLADYLKAVLIYTAKNNLIHGVRPALVRRLLRLSPPSKWYRRGWYFWYGCSFLPEFLLRPFLNLMRKRATN